MVASERFDVVVVGAGTAGCMASKVLASAGLEVCLIDYKPRDLIGKKVCGDAIGKHHFDNLGLAYPSGGELERRILGMRIYSPDQETAFNLKGEGLEGFMVNRHLFGQRLLKDALDAGTTLIDSTKVVEPIIKDGFIRGVVAINLESDERMNFMSKVVIDASGFSAAIRSRLPPETGLETRISRDDLIICYREIRKLKEPLPEPNICEIYLNLDVAPGGYYWIFPEGDSKVNVGLGVVARRGSPNPKDQLYRYVLSNRLFEGSSIIHGGGGYVPTRRPPVSYTHLTLPTTERV